MAITVTKHTILNESRRAVIKCHLVSGAALEVTNQVLIDASADLVNASIDYAVQKITSSGSDMDIDLHFDATANIDLITLPPGENIFDFLSIGGIVNNAGAGKTGDILFSTRGAAADTEATIIIELRIRGS